MSNRLLVPREKRFFLPSLIIPRSVLRYRGIWNGAEDFHGALLVEGRKGLEWVSLQYLFDGGWDGQPPTEAMLSHAIGLWAASAGVAVVPGSQTWTSSGSHSVTAYNRLEVAVWGGGGGGADNSDNGGSGGQGRYRSTTEVQGNGGGGGVAGGSNGSGGTASGGTTNTTGENGGVDGSAHGGDAASNSGTLLGTLTGGGGGTATADTGDIPGGGGSRVSAGGANGGGGGLAVKLWNKGDSGAPTVGASIITTVGSGGGGAGAGSSGDGARGEIRAQWD